MEATLNDDRLIVRSRLVEEHVRFENLHDLDGILGTFGTDARYDDEPWEDHRVGRDEVRSYYSQLIEVAPDFHIEVLRRHVTDEVVILEVVISGTHTGGWRGLPGTGSPFRFPLCAIYSFDQNDKLCGEKIYYDRATVLRQLGVFWEPTTVIGRLLTPITHPLTIAWAFGRKMLGQ